MIKKKHDFHRLSTGLPKLDKLLEGGFPSKTSVLVSGGPGTGKTLFGLNFLLEGARKGEKCYYLSLSEQKEELLRACSKIKSLSDAKKYVGKNLKIERICLGPELALKQFANLFAVYPEVDRLVIDNLNKLLIFAETKREYRMHLEDIVCYLKERVYCSLLLCETEHDEIDTGNGEAFETDGVLHLSFLELEEKARRMLEIVKMRYTAFQPLIKHNLSISDKALELTKIKAV